MKKKLNKYNLRELTWDEFINEQAIYILVSRPNNSTGRIMTFKKLASFI